MNLGHRVTGSGVARPKLAVRAVVGRLHANLGHRLPESGIEGPKVAVTSEVAR